MAIDELLAQITRTPPKPFCAGLVLRKSEGGWTVVYAAPILRRMIGWGAHEVKAYCDKQGWIVRKVEIAG